MVDLAFTSAQEMLRSSARELIEAEFPKDALVRLDQNDAEAAPMRRERWRLLASQGWMGILAPQEYGGAGGSLTDAAVIFHELGRGPVPGPHFATAALGTMLVLEAASEAQKRRYLPAIADGAMSLAVAVKEPAAFGVAPAADTAVGVTAQPSQNGEGYALNGRKQFVFEAGSASHLICEATLPSGELALFLLDTAAAGVTVRPLDGFVSAMSEIRFDNVYVSSDDTLGGAGVDAADAWRSALRKATPLLCAFQVGSVERVGEMTLEYSNTRTQFGLPIGRFQRVQDHVIEIVNRRDAAWLTAYEALWALDEGRPDADVAVHTAAALCREAHYFACNAAHEVHAGLGIMTEYGLTLHTRLSRTLYSYLGDPRYHRSRLATALGL